MQCEPITYAIRQGDTLWALSRYYKTTPEAILERNPGLDPYNLKIGTTVVICPGQNYAVAQPADYMALRPQDANNQQFYPVPPVQMPVVPPQNDKCNCGRNCNCNVSKHKLSDQMRKAWSQHVYWTRLLLISMAERLNDTNATTSRLLQNPKDIAVIFEKYYGAEVAKEIQQLLTEHLQIGGNLIAALRDGRRREAESLKNKWYENADKMAAAFSGINPYFNYVEMRNMLHTHLDLTTTEVLQRLSRNYAADIKAFDEVETDALSMADYFTDGIAKQFPQKF